MLYSLGDTWKDKIDAVKTLRSVFEFSEMSLVNFGFSKNVRQFFKNRQMITRALEIEMFESKKIVWLRTVLACVYSDSAQF